MIGFDIETWNEVKQIEFLRGKGWQIDFSEAWKKIKDKEKYDEVWQKIKNNW